MSKFTIINIKTAAAMTGLISKILDFKCTLINCLQQLDILPINVGK